MHRDIVAAGAAIRRRSGVDDLAFLAGSSMKRISGPPKSSCAVYAFMDNRHRTIRRRDSQPLTSDQRPVTR
jgi:hypothetical protein